MAKIWHLAVNMTIYVLKHYSPLNFFDKTESYNRSYVSLPLFISYAYALVLLAAIR